MEKNKLYLHTPEEQEWDVDQSLFDHTPVKQGENSVPELYSNVQKNLTEEDYDDLYNNSQTSRQTKTRKVNKATNTILTASAILVSSVVGIITVVNPLTMRPSVKNQQFLYENHVLSYKLDVSNRLNYDCNLVFFKDGEEANRINLDASKTYQGEYLVNEEGNYELKFISTNNVDYTNRVTLYTFTY